MNHTEKPAFLEMLKSTCSIYSKPATEADTLAPLYWSVLDEYPLEVVQQALRKHLKDPERGQFFPKPADLIRFIEGQELTSEQIISAARLTRTPLGVLCRIQIGHFDLEHNQDLFYLKQRAEECRQLIPEWKARARAGEYTEHQISTMLKYEVDPTSPLHDGLPAPGNRHLIEQKTEDVLGSKIHAERLGRLPEPESEPLKAAPNVREFLADLIKMH